MFFLTFCEHLEIAVLPAWELTFRQMWSHLFDFLVTSNASGLAFGPAGLQDPAHTAPRPSQSTIFVHLRRFWCDLSSIRGAYFRKLLAVVGAGF